VTAVEEPTPTRQELRAILANPDSTQEQVLQVKLILAKRIANGTNAVRQVCERYHLTPEQSEKLITGHESMMGEMEAKAASEARRLEQLLAELHGE